MAGDAKPDAREAENLPRFMLSYFATILYGLIWCAALLFTAVIVFDRGQNRDPSVGVLGLCVLAGSLSIARAIRKLR